MSSTFDQTLLSAGLHAETLTAQVCATGEQIACAIVWADREYENCPGCEAPVARVVDACPVTITTGVCEVWELQPLPQQHSCGHWLTVWWVGFRAAGTEPTPTEFSIGLSMLLSDIPADRADRLAALIAGEDPPPLPQPRGEPR